MNNFIEDFNKRVAEIEKYFNLVDKIEQISSFTEQKIIFPAGEYEVDSNLQKIMKSHCYLLLYNLIESSIRNGITAIHDAIQLDQLTYKELKINIQKLWIKNDLSKSFADSFIKKDKIEENLHEALKIVLDNTVISLESTNIPISGNLDAKTIQELIDMYGFYGNLGISKTKIDDVLNLIVKRRCDLAHGNVSFSEASEQDSWNDIINYKKKVIDYLTNLLNNIENYIDNKKYKQNTNDTSKEIKDEK